MKATIKDIARFADVSIGTVSKVINKKENVSNKLRQRVEAAIQKLNYRPSALAQDIRRSRTDIIGLVVPQIVNSFYVQIIDLIEKSVTKRGYTLFLCNSAENFEKELHYLRILSNMRIAGLILATSGRINPEKVWAELQTYEELEIPVVLIARSLDGSHCDTIVLNNVDGAYKATKHLLENGHHKTGIISSAAHTSASQERIDGYRKALTQNGIPLDESLIYVGGPNQNSSYDIAQKIFGTNEFPTALFVASNVQMLGALRAIKEKGLNVPDDISIICFDDTDWSVLANPPLTVVRPLTNLFCETALKFLFERIDKNYSGLPRTEIIPTELVIRSSVKLLK